VKLFIIIKSSLTAGLYTAQAIHAFWSFTRAFPQKTLEWAPDNNVVILQHEDLASLADRLDSMGLAVARFHEPDLNDELTAICAEPAAKRHLAKLPLAA
jgi:hypothetical protein